MYNKLNIRILCYINKNIVIQLYTIYAAYYSTLALWVVKPYIYIIYYNIFALMLYI